MEFTQPASASPLHIPFPAQCPSQPRLQWQPNTESAAWHSEGSSKAEHMIPPTQIPDVIKSVTLSIKSVTLSIKAAGSSHVSGITVVLGMAVVDVLTAVA
jgi:hypothetical protein